MSDFVVLGAGIAGASAAYHLADHGSVVILERESVPGYHSTGRSAALFTETYGNAAIRALTVASGRFLRAPPAGFAEQPLLLPRGVMMIAPAEDGARFAQAVEIGRCFAPNLRVLDRAAALEMCPVLRPDWFEFAFFEPDAMDMDVHALHQGFLRAIRAKGGTIVTDATPMSIDRCDEVWTVDTPRGRFSAPVLVNAAGAWADDVARLAGVPPVGLSPRRRTAVVVDAPDLPAIGTWPLVGDIAETFYFKPEAGHLLISPADETPVPPCDVQPEEIDVANAIARIEEATTMRFRRVIRKWAGLRTFAPDRTLVIGPDPAIPGFVWAAGQGGYGIQTSPAAGRAAAAMAVGEPFPDDLTALGLASADLLPDRLRPATG